MLRSLLLLLTVLLGGAGPLLAQPRLERPLRDSTCPEGSGGLAGTSCPPAHLVIRHVLIRAHDVYRPEEAFGLIPRFFNGFHLTTRPRIVRRELLLKPGQPYDSALVAESARSLRALGVFRRVIIDSVRSDSGLVLRVETQDAFSTRIEGSVSGSLRHNSWWVALNEYNLLGQAAQVSIKYRQTPDRHAVTTSFTKSRLIAGLVGVSLAYDNRSDGRVRSALISKPFFSFKTRTSWSLLAEEQQGRVLRFADGLEKARDTLERSAWLARAEYGWAIRRSTEGYLRAGVAAQARRDDYAAFSRLDTLTRTVTGAMGGFLEWRTARYIVGRDIVGFGRQEDIDLSTVLGAGLFLTPKALGYREDGVVPSVRAQVGYDWEHGFGILMGRAHGRWTDAGAIDSGSVQIAGMAVRRLGRRDMAIAYAGRGWQHRPVPGTEFDLGLSQGPRGFAPHAFTGDRIFLVATEYRHTVTDNLLRSAGLGLAAFAEYGGAWYSGQPLRTGYSIGIGLRVGLTVSTDLSPARLDVGYVNGTGLAKGSWRLTVGKGFVFNTTGRLDQ